MPASSIIKYLLSDTESLFDYQQGKVVSFEDTKRRLFLTDRNTNRNIPDHYYLLNKEFSLRQIHSLPDVLSKGISRIAIHYLELRDKRIYVKQELQNEWQELITYMPPLLLISSFLEKKIPVDWTSSKAIKEFYYGYIVPNTRYTALPYPYLPQLELYNKENKGFHDLHMHLNGTTETDVTWQDFLFEPDKVYNDLKKGFSNPLAREQYAQEAYHINPENYFQLLKSAQRLRQFFFYFLYPRQYRAENTEKDPGESLQEKPVSIPGNTWKILSEVNRNERQHSVFPDRAFHPFYDLIFRRNVSTRYDRRNLLSIESLMYVYLLHKLSLRPHDGLANMFHYYLLILGFTNRLLVQQTHQKGFIQFKKLTVNELREASEKAYTNRFFQLQGNELRNIRVLEGRFSPKDTRAKNERLLESVSHGWNALKKEVEKEQEKKKDSSSAGLYSEQPQLKLVAHFIKEPDDRKDLQIRHKNLRCRVWNRALVLAFMKKNDSPALKDVVGVDAASSEFDAPPEVFAPAFRMLRRKGFNHFTYHAGEDFYHILTGLRAIYEAVCFNELRSGDRIGHATASGLCARLWRDNMGPTLLMRRGEYMDDLTFIYHFLMTETRKNTRLEPFKTKLPFLANRIQEYGNIIYNNYHSLKTYEDAWLLRRFCPITMKTLSLPDEKTAWQKFRTKNPLQEAEELSTFDLEEWCDIRQEISQVPATDQSVELLLKYHAASYSEPYNEIIEVPIEDCFTLEEIQQLQLAVLNYLHRKEIVIETLPTSNVRIGHHDSFHTYHLWNWITWEEEGNSIPPIVVGTDDTGIFATNIYNEFANIYCFLTHIKKVSHTKAMEIIRKLEMNARIYQFR